MMMFIKDLICYEFAWSVKGRKYIDERYWICDMAIKMVWIGPNLWRVVYTLENISEHKNSFRYDIVTSVDATIVKIPMIQGTWTS